MVRSIPHQPQSHGQETSLLAHEKRASSQGLAELRAGGAWDAALGGCGYQVVAQV